MGGANVGRVDAVNMWNKFQVKKICDGRLVPPPNDNLPCRGPRA